MLKKIKIEGLYSLLLSDQKIRLKIKFESENI